MPLDLFAAKGSTKASRPDAGQANLRDVPVFATVKDNIDPIRAGRLQVYIDDLGGSDPDNADSWVTVNYLPPFYGHTTPDSSKTEYGSLTTNPSSYGMWFSPPDIGTQVICIFVNGDPNYGFYIGAIPNPDALRMIPAIGANFDKEPVVFNEKEASSYGGATRLPVTNMNTNNQNLTETPNFVKSPKPVHSYSAMIMNQQGVIRDPIRGPIGTSAQRESPSRVGWGVSTPGRPIYEGGYTDESIATTLSEGTAPPENLKIIGRRGGHSIVMDDGDLIGNDQLIRLRTALGHQILMSDNGQTLMILHSNGQSYIELGKEGTIDMYSTNSVNIRTQGDLNLHADNNVNIHANKKLNVYAESINLESDKDFNQKVGADSSIFTMGAHTHKVTGSMAFSASSEASFSSGGAAYINGSKLNLNSGESSTVPSTVPSINKVAQTDTLYDSEKGFIAAPGKLLTIVSRAPAHAPWSNAGQGVDVKTDLGADSQFPSPPNDAVASATENAGPVDPTQAVTPQGIATVPPVEGASGALDKPTTGALIGTMAQSAATGATAAAVAAGAGVVKSVTGTLTAAVGATGLSPSQLEAAKILKPGTSPVINGLIGQGMSVDKAMSSCMFTGKSGVTDLASFINNTQSQVNATADLLKSSQKALTVAGVINGTESPSAVGGVILAGATVGAKETIDTIKNAGTNAVTSAKNALGGVGDSVTKAISAGNYAAKVGETGINGPSGILNSVTKTLGNAVESAKGAAFSAFDAIKKSFEPFKAGVPQDLGAIAAAKKAAQSVMDVGKTAVEGEIGGVTKTVDQLTKGIGAIGNINANTLSTGFSGAIDTVTGVAKTAVGGALGGITGAVSGLTKGISAVNGAINQAKTTAVGTVGAAASGIANLTGGQQAISTVTDAAKGVANNIPGIGVAKDLVNNASEAAKNGISLAKAAESSSLIGTGISAKIGGALENLKTGVNDAINGIATKLKEGTTGLLNLVTSGLPPAAAAKLQAALSSVSSIGETKIGLPSIGSNTTNRDAINAQSTALLGDKKIPPPNLSGEVGPAATAAVTKLEDSLSEKIKQLDEAYKKIKEQDAILAKAAIAYNDAKETLPAGSPQVDILYEKAKEEAKKFIDLKYKLIELQVEIRKVNRLMNIKG